MNEACFSIPKNDLPVFVACLGVGTLQAIRDGILPLEVGIWTLSSPIFIKSIEDNDISPEVVNVFQTADELSALKELAPEEFKAQVDLLINRLLQELISNPNPTWSIKWILCPKDNEI